MGVVLLRVEHPHAIAPVTKPDFGPHPAEGIDGAVALLIGTRRLKRGRVAGGQMTAASEAVDDRSGDDRPEALAAVVLTQPDAIDEQYMGAHGAVELGTVVGVKPRSRGWISEVAD